MPMIIYECKNAPLYSMTPGLLVFLKLTLREIREPFVHQKY